MNALVGTSRDLAAGSAHAQRARCSARRHWGVVVRYCSAICLDTRRCAFLSVWRRTWRRRSAERRTTKIENGAAMNEGGSRHEMLLTLLYDCCILTFHLNHSVKKKLSSRKIPRKTTRGRSLCFLCSVPNTNNNKKEWPRLRRKAEEYRKRRASSLFLSCVHARIF